MHSKRPNKRPHLSHCYVSVAVIGILCACMPAAARLPARYKRRATAQPIHIIFPKPRSTVNVGSQVIAEVSPSFLKENVKSVQFAFSADGKHYSPISGITPLGVAEYAVLWNAGSLKSGNYWLRARLIPVHGSIKTDTVSIHLHEQPSAVARVQPSDAQPLRVRFDASQSSAKESDISLYEWDFGDETTGLGRAVEHSYSRLGTYGVALTVHDTLGGRNTGHYILPLLLLQDQNTVPALETKDACGCKKMTIKGDGPVDGPADDQQMVVGQKMADSIQGFNFWPGTSSGIPDTPDPAKPISVEQKKFGPYNDGATGNQLDLTKDQLSVANRFEVIAELKDQSKPQLCAQGQKVQSSDTLLGSEDKRKGNKNVRPALRLK
jgi:hypothetical protein